MRPLIRSRRVALPLAALALAGAGVAAYGAVGDDSVDYRTVSATTGSVEQELSLSGTISPSGSSELAFGTAGTVAKVRVEQGDTVEEGDVIAVLDRASLRAAVDRAASDLASAKAQLADDREAQTTAVTTSTSSSSASATAGRSGSSGSSSGGAPSSGAPSSGAPSSGTSSSTAAVVKQLTAQQDAVLAAQTAAGTALSAAGTALADQQTACADPVTTTESTDAATDSATDVATGGTTADAGTTTTAVLSEECSAALAAVQSAQTTASEAQTALQKALETLGSTLTDALGSVQADPSTGSSGGGSTGSGSAPSGTGTTGSTGATGSTGSSAAAPAGGASGQTVTAATLAQDQASIDRARADLVAAEADLAGAVVRAPADGTVASLAVATDDEVAAGDTVATVVAPGLTTVSVEATATQAAQLEQGMDVEVTPAGATEALAGAVSRIEHVATSDSSTGSDPTYTVGIVLDERDLQLADGMPASVAAVVGAADDVVVVPASAVSNGSVTVVEDGVAQRVRVTTGIVGATQIEVTDGLEAGDEVVLADLDADLPSGGSEQGGFGGGGFGGGGGGFPAGGPPSGVFPAR
ncbi:hypothetical protein CFH99_16035 [Nocardioides aromaticivorans]|uniref:Membrane fusion protein biotin-lipoyl like domain-containing protein n=1 Tax=Nocardioides aromaticivorans TaxID=200618 RepID=A0ABX7PND2_9ACTN|nr:biotin/lipoyl-binding protein [Nocardioides aromaticivorans]QSR27130.1 hypothetical protein CFH99_16035 [Nocardioides aromaticivorans]